MIPIATKRKAIKGVLFASMLLLFADFIYRTINNIDYLNRKKCFLFSRLPRPLFLFFEHFVELALIILLGIFFAVLLEKAYLKYKRFYPTNPLQAFVYGSLLPFCSCGAIPLIGALKDKTSVKTLLTFIVAAPLLSPYIVVMSMAVLGVKFTLLRIAASFVLAISSGYVVEWFVMGTKADLPSGYGCSKFLNEQDLYLRTAQIARWIFPYFLIAGAMGMAFEYVPMEVYMNNLQLNNPYWGTFVAIAVGIPVYLCNGADVLLLRPFFQHEQLIPWGTAVGFSMTSTAICVTSMVMLSKYLGVRVVGVLAAHILLVTFVLGLLINRLF